MAGTAGPPCARRVASLITEVNWPFGGLFVHRGPSLHRSLAPAVGFWCSLVVARDRANWMMQMSNLSRDWVERRRNRLLTTACCPCVRAPPFHLEKLPSFGKIWVMIIWSQLEASKASGSVIGCLWLMTTSHAHRLRFNLWVHSQPPSRETICRLTLLVLNCMTRPNLTSKGLPNCSRESSREWLCNVSFHMCMPWVFYLGCFAQARGPSRIFATVAIHYCFPFKGEQRK